MNADALNSETLIEGLRCGVADWADIWGDPWISGSTLVLAYAITAFLIFRASRYSIGRERWLWRLCGVFFALQMFNTPLDLHAMIFTTGRCLAHAQGWYEDRREVQTLFLTSALVLSILLITSACLIFRRSLLQNFFLVFGVMLALGFTMVKGTSHHFLDPLYGDRIGPFFVADLVELSGIAIACLAAVVRIASRKHHQNLPNSAPNHSDFRPRLR